MNWQLLQQRFYRMADKSGCVTHYSSGNIHVEYTQDGVTVEFGGYDVFGWARHTVIGPFKTEEEAYRQALAKIHEGELEYEQHRLEEKD